MHKIYSPETEFDLTFIKSLLEAEGVEYFVQNDHFGSLEIGPVINLYNSKNIFVSEKDIDKSKEIIENYLQTQQEDHSDEKTKYNIFHSFKRSARLVIEFLIFGWCVPGTQRNKKKNLH